MTYLDAIISIFQYLILYPAATLLGWLFVLLAPVLHLGHYVLYALLVPLRLMGKFETLYIFFGVAAVVGVLTGSVLHLSSSFLVTAFGLQSNSQNGDPFAPLLAENRREKRAQRFKTPLAKLKQRPKIDTSRSRDYIECLEKDRGKRMDGLLSTTILEEDDDSGDGLY